MQVLRMLCYDIQPLIMDGLKIAISKHRGFDLIGAHNSLDQFYIDLQSPGEIDAIVIGLLTSEGSNISLLEKILMTRSNSLLIVYSIIESKFIIDSLIEIGVSKIIHKRVGSRVLLNEIIQLSNENIGRGKNEKKLKKNSGLYLLKEREIILVNLMADGLSAQKIGEKMNRSIHTINNKKNELIKRFSCDNSNELIAKLIRFGYIKL